MPRLAVFCAAFLVIVSLISLGLLALSPSYNECIRGNGQHATEHYTADGRQIVEGPIDNPTATRLFVHCGSMFANRNGEAFTGLFTVALTIATFLLGYLAWDQGRVSRAQTRPYVMPNITGVRKFSLIEPIEVRVDIKNIGPTPALDVETHAEAFVAILPLPDTATFPPSPKEDHTGRHSRITLYPGQHQNIDAESVDILNPETIAALKAREPKIAIYISGEVHYRDVFGGRHTSQFCSYIHAGDAKSLIAIEEGNLSATDFEVRFSQAHILNRAT